MKARYRLYFEIETQKWSCWVKIKDKPYEEWYPVKFGI